MALLIEFGSFILIPNGALPAFLRILGGGFACLFVFLFCNHPTQLLKRLPWELTAAPLVLSDFSYLETPRRYGRRSGGANDSRKRPRTAPNRARWAPLPKADGVGTSSSPWREASGAPTGRVGKTDHLAHSGWNEPRDRFDRCPLTEE